MMVLRHIKMPEGRFKAILRFFLWLFERLTSRKIFEQLTHLTCRRISIGLLIILQIEFADMKKTN